MPQTVKLISRAELQRLSNQKQHDSNADLQFSAAKAPNQFRNCNYTPQEKGFDEQVEKFRAAEAKVSMFEPAAIMSRVMNKQTIDHQD